SLFFQAEDGIRDRNVTGVQTCALPISSLGGFDGASPFQMAGAYAAFGNGGEYNQPLSVKKIVYPDGKEWEPEENKSTEAMQDYRSEERRVGKECSSWRSSVV